MNKYFNTSTKENVFCYVSWKVIRPDHSESMRHTTERDLLMAEKF